MKTIRSLFCLFALAAAGAILHSAPGPRADDDARVEGLIKRHLSAVGGESALARISTRRATGWIERNQTKIPFVQSQRAPNLIRTETRFPRPGTLRQGFDGTTGWVLHPQQGGRKLGGRELAAVAASAWLSPAQHFGELFAVRRWGGARTLDGRAMLALDFAVREGEPVETWLFEAETALLARIEKTVDGGSQGIVALTLLFEDYREKDGVKFPMRVRTRLPKLETVLQFDLVEHNVAFPDGFFAAPF